MSPCTQHWPLSEQSGVPDCNRIDESLIQVSWVQDYHSTAPYSELQGQLASPQEIFLASYPGYTSHFVTPMHNLIHDATHPGMIEEQDSTTPEHELADQLYLLCGNGISSPGNVLWPLPIPSIGAAGHPTPPTTTNLLAVRTSTAGPHVIELVGAENDLRAVGSLQIQRAAGKRRKKNGIYQCPFRNAGCHATFTAPHNLRYHLNAHRGLKPYECTECSYAAASPATVKRHMKQHLKL